MKYGIPTLCRGAQGAKVICESHHVKSLFSLATFAVTQPGGLGSGTFPLTFHKFILEHSSSGNSLFEIGKVKNSR